MRLRASGMPPEPPCIRPKSCCTQCGNSEIEAAKTERSRFMKATRFVPNAFAGFLARALHAARATHLFFASVFFLAALSAVPQTTPAAPQSQPAQNQPQRESQQELQQGEQHRGQVIYSSSTDENGQTTTTVGPGATRTAAPTGQSVDAPTASDAEREAVTFTEFNMDVHLRSAEHEIAVRAFITVRNDGKSPLAHVPLEISSALHWERIRVAAHDALYTIATRNSDTDHTGQLHEAAVKLATPLAPGATLRLDVT